jgi:hypothetical protein
LWGCALVAGLVVAVIAGIVVGIAALAGAFSTHTATAVTGAAGQADGTLCAQIHVTAGDPSNVYGHGSFPPIRQAERGASPDLVTLVNELEAAYGDNDFGQETQVLSEVDVWCADNGFNAP